jgi:hypothetical protein
VGWGEGGQRRIGGRRRLGWGIGRHRCMSSG